MSVDRRLGHRVYRNIDPRAKEMKKLTLDCIGEFERSHRQDSDAYVTSAYGANAGGSPKQLRELFALAVELEKAALADDYFVSRELFLNVDYYSGLALTAMGIPTTLFTCLFAVGRSAGWVAQWLEALAEPKRRISRPRQVYVGETKRAYPNFRTRALLMTHQPSFTDSTQDESDFGYFF